MVRALQAIVTKIGKKTGANRPVFLIFSHEENLR